MILWWGGVSRCLGVVQARVRCRLEKAVSLEIKVPDQGLPSRPPPGDTTIFWVGVPRPPKRFNYLLGGGATTPQAIQLHPRGGGVWVILIVYPPLRARCAAPFWRQVLDQANSSCLELLANVM